MPASLPPARSTRSLRRPYHRLGLAWGVFAVGLIALAAAMYRVHDTMRRDLDEQSERAQLEEQAKAEERIRAQVEITRLATIKALAGFHVEGLGHALRQWAGATPAIVGTFRWEPGRGFLPGSELGGEHAERERLVELWSELRRWRAEHPAANERPPSTVGRYRTVALRTLDHPMLPPAELGYQAENLDMLTYAGRVIDPWAGWAGRIDDATAPWVFWYQLGHDAPVRGCLFDPAALVAELQLELIDSPVARVELVPVTGATDGVPRNLVRLTDALPGHGLTVAPGELFLQKEDEAKWSAAIVALLLIGVALGVVSLARYSRREARDAEHKTTFVTQVSHELRTPLTSIRMFADMLANPELAEEKRIRFARTISRESERLSGLIERLLLFSALEKAKHSPAIAEVDICAVVRETIEEMDGSLRSAGMHAVVALPPEPVTAATDRSTLKQALLNLLDNAVKYARDGRAIHVAVVRDGAAVCLRVADEGPGIPGAIRHRVFEPFVQGGQSLTEKSPGVGLGLSLARALLRKVGGDLVLVPSERGAVFEIQIPSSEAP